MKNRVALGSVLASLFAMACTSPSIAAPGDFLLQSINGFTDTSVCSPTTGCHCFLNTNGSCVSGFPSGGSVYAHLYDYTAVDNPFPGVLNYFTLTVEGDANSQYPSPANAQSNMDHYVEFEVYSHVDVTIQNFWATNVNDTEGPASVTFDWKFVNTAGGVVVGHFFAPSGEWDFTTPHTAKLGPGRYRISFKVNAQASDGGIAEYKYFGNFNLTEVPCPADFDRNGVVDFFDYLDFLDAYNDDCATRMNGWNACADADFNGDGVVDLFDYLDFVDAYSNGCP